MRAEQYQREMKAKADRQLEEERAREAAAAKEKREQDAEARSMAAIARRMHEIDAEATIRNLPVTPPSTGTIDGSASHARSGRIKLSLSLCAR